eukprot:TRINITY_DN5623_c0_g1_i1.p1 TRINITY_DN5623_c0_g1~~TRINITY_DN5623_c0_g1_i1.p1  ORF type:complete len:541 (+),score=17.87 TRINITY_DN5623_c0_g1_i1:101-1723(+)
MNDGPQGRRRSSGSYDQCAAAFLEVVVQSRPVPVQACRNEAGSLREKEWYPRALQLWQRVRHSLAFVVLKTVLWYPFLLFVIMVPLQLDTVPIQLYNVYFWTIFHAVALYFADGILVTFVDGARRLPVIVLLALWMVMSAACQAAAYVLPCPMKTCMFFVGALFSLNLPSVLFGVSKGFCHWQVVTLTGLMVYGATPVIVSAAFYVVVHGSASDETGASWRIFIVLLWLLVQAPVKDLGERLSVILFTDQFMQPLGFSIYIDIVFGILGFATFADTWYGSATFLLSLCVQLVLAMQGGRACCHSFLRRFFGCSATLQTRQLALLLRCCSLILGRLAAYGIFFFATLQGILYGSDNRIMVVHPNLVPNGMPVSTTSHRIFVRHSTGYANICVAAVCAWASFMLLLSLPCLSRLAWGSRENGVVRIMQATSRDQLGTPSLGNAPLTPPASIGQRHEDYSEAVSADRPELSPRSSTTGYSETRPEMADECPALDEVLGVFVRELGPFMGSCCMFVVLTCAATTSLAEIALHRFEGGMCTDNHV